jgi:hypothetical protein
MGRTMSDIEDDLKATAADIAADASELQAIEEEKTRLAPDDPRMSRLARLSERIVRRILPKATVQRELIDAAATAGSGEGKPN